MSKQKHSTLDLTQGSTFKLLIVFTLPILAGQLLQNLYNSVDSIVVGQFVGTTALASVSMCADISQLLVGFFVGLSTGAGVLFSRYFGARDYKKLHDSIHTGISFSVILGFAMAALGVLISPLLMDLVKCPEDMRAEATTYMRIYFAGMLFTSIYNVGSGVLRAVGNSRDPFIYLAIASGVNIVLDVVFVLVFDMGVMGVAVATVLAQAISVVLVFRNMLKVDDVYKFSFREMKMDKAILLEILDLGLPAAIQNSITNLSNFFVQRYINTFGSVAVAGVGAAKKIDRYASMAINSIGLSLTTFVSQNMGAGKKERAFKGIAISFATCCAFMLVVCIPSYYYANIVLRIFTNDPETLRYGAAMLHVVMPMYLFQILYVIFANSNRGFGHSKAAMYLSLGGMVVVRQIFLNIAMQFVPSFDVVIFCYPVGWLFAGLFCWAYYMHKVRLPYLRERKKLKV